MHSIWSKNVSYFILMLVSMYAVQKIIVSQFGNTAKFEARVLRGTS